MAFYTPRKRKPTINIVSLMDILAILLIFFVVTTTFKKPEGKLQINLPESETAVEQAGTNVPALLAVTADSEIYLDDEPLHIDDVANALRNFQQENPEKTIMLKPDTDVPFGTIVRIFDAATQAGLPDLPTFIDPKKKES